MSKLASEREALHMHIQFLYGGIFVCLVIMAALWYGWFKSPEYLQISIPPDLRNGALVRPGEFQAVTIEAFAVSTFRDLHRWEEDGGVDYGKKIKKNEAYLTPRYREWLVQDMNQRAEAGELRGRVRWTLELDGSSYNRDNVVAYDDGTWVVYCRLKIFEEVGGLQAKDISVEYPLRIVRMNISPKHNFWGLALDGYPGGLGEEVIEDDAKDS